MAFDREVGITSYGIYIPWNRLKREDVAKAWQSTGSGEKAVASYDEDSLTMAVEAARSCLWDGSLKKRIGSLYFCSTTPPYLEKQSASTIAEVLGLNETVMTVDIADSLRAGTQGILLALDAVRAGKTQMVLVCAADRRLGLPSGSNEMFFGDGAAAFCIGNQDMIAVIEGSYSIREEIISFWRSDRDPYVRSYEERFGLEMGYKRTVLKAVKMALNQHGLKPSDVHKVVIYAAHPRHIGALGKELGFDPKTQIQDGLFSHIGNTGVAQIPMNLIATFEKVEAGERVLVVNYSDGCDVLILRITDHIYPVRKNRKSIADFLKNKRYISYIKYMRWRDVFPVEPPQRAPLEVPSSSALWRDNTGLALIGGKCRACGTVQYPAFRVCIECGSKDQMEPYGLADKKGKIVAFSHDNLATSSDPPATVAVVDFDEGGRIMCDVTDRDPEEIRVGMPVEMKFRVLRYVGGIYLYWWKCVPTR